MSTREQILDAFELLLISEGDRGASLNAVAAKAGVSKGGLLYHFGSKEALIEGVLDRLMASLQKDIAEISKGPREGIEYFIKVSAADSPDRQSERALQVLATVGNEQVMRRSLEMQNAWRDAFLAYGLSPEVVTHIMLVSDGLYSDFSLVYSALAYDNDDVKRDASIFKERVENDLDAIVRQCLAIAGLES